MCKFSGTLLVSDMDGTLLTDDKRVSERNREAIRYFIKNGGLFALASGRAPVSLEKYRGQIPVNAPVITLNGAALYDMDRAQIVWEGGLDDRAAAEVMELVAGRFPSTGIEVYTREGIHLVLNNNMTRRHMEIERLPFALAELGKLPRPFYKVLFADEPETLKQIEQYLRQQNIGERFPQLRFVYSERTYYEMLSREDSKGAVLLRLAEMLGVGRNRLYCIGDNYNDAELFEVSALGFAPDNAVPEIKKRAARAVCSNNDGAVADTIQYLDKIL